ncbi:MAG: zinc ribbon domain-containing protein [Chloroflexi bacterium]|nr:zinc ribbon domain-containing protein [Chloroflexota bacterium]
MRRGYCTRIRQPARAVSGEAGQSPNPLAPARACPSCGRGVQADWRNCPHCGVALA